MPSHMQASSPAQLVQISGASVLMECHSHSWMISCSCASARMLTRLSTKKQTLPSTSIFLQILPQPQSASASAILQTHIQSKFQRFRLTFSQSKISSLATEGEQCKDAQVNPEWTSPPSLSSNPSMLSETDRCMAESDVSAEFLDHKKNFITNVPVGAPPKHKGEMFTSFIPEILHIFNLINDRL